MVVNLVRLLKPSKSINISIVAGGTILLAASPLILSSYGLSLMTQVLIFGMLAMSLNLLVGYTGLLSFNHATFFGVSGYVAGLLVTRGFSNFWVLLLGGIIFAMLLAALIGLILLRSSGPYFFMLTLAFGQLVFAVAWKWRSLTGGDDGLPGIGRPQIGLNIFLSDNKSFYYIVLFIFLIVFSTALEADKLFLRQKYEGRQGK